MPLSSLTMQWSEKGIVQKVLEWKSNPKGPFEEEKMFWVDWRNSMGGLWGGWLMGQEVAPSGQIGCENGDSYKQQTLLAILKNIRQAGRHLSHNSSSFDSNPESSFLAIIRVPIFSDG